MTPADRVIDYTARKFESGPVKEPYAVLTLDDAGAGISFGFIQFNQKMGGFSTLLREMNSQAPSLFTRVFGAYAPKMLSQTWVQTTNLAADADFITRLRMAGGCPEFQQAQRNVAKRLYFDAIVATVKHVGLRSERAYAMMFDTAVQRGPGNANALLVKAATDTHGHYLVPEGAVATPEQELAILKVFAVYADTTTRVGRVDRRSKMLDDPGLADTPFAQE